MSQLFLSKIVVVLKYVILPSCKYCTPTKWRETFIRYGKSSKYFPNKWKCNILNGSLFWTNFIYIFSFCWIYITHYIIIEWNNGTINIFLARMGTALIAFLKAIRAVPILAVHILATFKNVVTNMRFYLYKMKCRHAVKKNDVACSIWYECMVYHL